MTLHADKLSYFPEWRLADDPFQLSNLFIPRLGPMMITDLLPLYAQLSFLLTIINSGVDLDFFFKSG